MPQNLVEMAREKAMKKHRPTEFRETHEAVERLEFDHQVLARAAAEAARARAANRAAELRGAEPKLGAVGPAWTRGEFDKPEGERHVGSSTELYYTPEQQARLGVDEQGKNVDKEEPEKIVPVPSAKPPAKVKNALEDAREKAAQKARERAAAVGAPKETAQITTSKPLFGYFHPDGAFATGLRKGITGNPHGHIGNHFRATRKNWVGFGGRRRRRRSRGRKQRGGCGQGLCMSGGHRRRRKTRRRRRKKRRTRRRRKKRSTRRRRRGGFSEKCKYRFLFQNFNNKFQCGMSKMMNPKEKFTCGIDGYCKNTEQAAAQHAAIKKYTGVSL